MKKINRIKANSDFALTIKKGKTYYLNQFLVFVKPNEYPYVRIGISVSKKIGNAVVRNKVKRQIRAIVDQSIDYNQSCLDIVIVVKPLFLEKSFDDNKSRLSDFLTKQVGSN